MILTEEDAQRFWRKVILTDHCWVWSGSFFWNGYGLFKADKKNRKASRVAWQLVNGPIPLGKCVLHTCDNRFCVCPEHLYLGSHKDNAQDMVDRGRQRNTRKTECVHGHAFTKENTRVLASGVRQCRECGKLRDRKRYPARYEEWKRAHAAA